nr:transposase [Aestuariibaculum marinum]
MPGGGLTPSGRWKPVKHKGKYLFPVKAMSKVFRARFVAQLRKESNLEMSSDFYNSLFKQPWVVYCKRPFLGPEQVIEYLGRYTHKIAISNHRILAIENGSVTFSVKDYRHGGKRKTMCLPDAEFIRRFALHILPKGFVRIRHYGMLSSYHKKVSLPKLKTTLTAVKLKEKPALLHNMCPKCQKGHLITMTTFTARGPPKHWIEQLNKPQ